VPRKSEVAGRLLRQGMLGVRCDARTAASPRVHGRCSLRVHVTGRGSKDASETEDETQMQMQCMAIGSSILYVRRK
jgi:hypothetical protein